MTPKQAQARIRKLETALRPFAAEADARLDSVLDGYHPGTTEPKQKFSYAKASFSNLSRKTPVSERYPILDAVQAIIKVAEKINHHNVKIAQNCAQGCGDTKGLYRDYMSANYPTVGVYARELDEAFQTYYECFKQT